MFIFVNLLVSVYPRFPRVGRSRFPIRRRMRPEDFDFIAESDPTGERWPTPAPSSRASSGGRTRRCGSPTGWRWPRSSAPAFSSSSLTAADRRRRSGRPHRLRSLKEGDPLAHCDARQSLHALATSLAPLRASGRRTVVAGRRSKRPSLSEAGKVGPRIQPFHRLAAESPGDCNSQGRRLNTALVLRSLRSGRLEGRSPGPGIVLRDASPKATLLEARGR